MTLSQILANIKRSLEWRGPSGAKQGHIVITWDEACYLHDHIIALIIERDGLLFDLENSRKEADKLWDHITKIYLGLKPDTPDKVPPAPTRRA